MIEIMFETFEVPSYMVAISNFLSLIASGRTTGLALNVGDGVTSVVPIYEGYCVSHGIQRINYAGRDLDDYMGFLLHEIGMYPVSSA